LRRERRNERPELAELEAWEVRLYVGG